jgi:hypothetical protein
LKPGESSRQSTLTRTALPSGVSASFAWKAVDRRRDRRLLLVLAEDRDDDDLDRRDVGRQDEARVVAVGHDRGPDHARREAPRRAVRVLADVVAVEELDAGGPREVLAEHVARAGLERLLVAHHGFDAPGVQSAPGNFSLSVLRPLITGIASQSSDTCR